MEVRPGYKQTEVGIIPEEWDSTKLGNSLFFAVAPLQRGHRLTTGRNPPGQAAKFQ